MKMLLFMPKNLHEFDIRTSRHDGDAWLRIVDLTKPPILWIAYDLDVMYVERFERTLGTVPALYRFTTINSLFLMYNSSSLN